MLANGHVRWFRDIGLGDVPLVGGKNASLGELYSVLSDQGVNVPNGFALTAEAYRGALTEAKAWGRLHGLLDGFDKRQVDVLAQRAEQARAIVFEATGTRRIREAVADAYAVLEAEYGSGVAVAVRSSATAEDLPTASFAGQHESFLNVRGAEDLFAACRRCFASIFTDRAISYRLDNGFDQFKVALSSDWHGWSSSSASTLAFIRWRWCSRTRSRRSAPGMPSGNEHKDTQLHPTILLKSFPRAWA